jgi:spermidine/putrescine ABC transporter ATP-binding subunit
MGASVDLVDLRKTFGRVVPVDGVSIRVDPGEFLTLLGPSGSGKTTTLMMLAGIEFPDSGTIRINGHDITWVPSHHRPIGVVFQNYALFPHMTVFENIAFSLRMRHYDQVDIVKRVGQALDLVHLSGLGGRYPRQLSGGQQQRVALARALVFEPAVLLLDEPLGALDRKLRETMKFEFRNIREKLATTVIYVTHDQEEALVLSDRIAVMNQGRIEQIDSAVDLYERPANLFVAEFIGESNFLPGRVTSCLGSNAVVQANALSVHCQAGGQLANGDEVVVAIRPERILIAAGKDTDAATHAATITDAIYVGEAMRYVARLVDGTAIVVKQQRRPGSGVFTRGTAVALSWDCEDARCFHIDRQGKCDVS